MAGLLPTGEGTCGVASAEASVRGLKNVPELATTELSKRMRLLKGYSDDLCRLCAPAHNPDAYRRCQDLAEPAVKGLLTLVLSTNRTDVRVSGLNALARLCFNHLGNASAVVTSEELEPVLDNAFRAVADARQQEELLAAVQLLQAAAAAAPEAPSLVAVLPKVSAVLIGERDGYAACRAARMVALEFLVSCSLSHQQRHHVAEVLPESALTLLLESVEDPASAATAWIFPLGLLLANLCDLPILGSNSPSTLFGAVAQPFWTRHNFFDDLIACLQASMRSEPWPPLSGIYHMSWKLANTCMRLALAGYVNELRGAVGPLSTLVEQHAQSSEAAGMHGAFAPARAARLAAAALRELTAEEELRTEMRNSHRLTEALVQMTADEPAALALLEVLGGVGGAADLGTVDSRPADGESRIGPIACDTATAQPW
mmetsp:Transcript_52958/g.95244  ORF Transcript_52958/g.95244 Transcript_52958/m.95244 type:complete len:429 (+) Transcript_52958:75-1361(+)